MASINEIQALVEQIKADLPLLVQRSQIAPRQIVVGAGLSDISERLGLVMAGEFRTGNGLEPGLGFSGVRIGYPAFVYDGDTWNIVGVNNDVMQIGIRSSDGKLIAGGGNVVIDADGILIKNINAVSDAFMTFRGPDGELLGRIHTNVIGNLEMGAFGQSEDNAERKLVLRSQIDDGLTNVATIEIIANSGDTGVDWITLNSDSVNIPGTALIGGIATFDSGTDKRLEIGADHYFPTRNSSNPNGFWNEANQDMDLTIEGVSGINLISDAGLNAIGIGGAAQSGYKLNVTGNTRITGSLEGLQDALMIYGKMAIFHSWESTNGFTASHTGTGTFTSGFLTGDASTGATSGSRVCLYSNATVDLWPSGSTLIRFRSRVNPRTVTTTCVAWLGFLQNPTAPTATEHHIAFKIDGGTIYASAGNGSAGNLESTGVSITQFSLVDLAFKQYPDKIEFYVDGTLTNTFTTNLPGVFNSARMTFYLATAVAADRTFRIWPYWYMQGS
jgi:hypothetical protein